jgi:hypothetical protein
MKRYFAGVSLSILLITMASGAPEIPHATVTYKVTILRNLGGVNWCNMGEDKREAKTNGVLWGRPSSYNRSSSERIPFRSASDIFHVGWGFCTTSVPTQTKGAQRISEAQPQGYSWQSDSALNGLWSNINLTRKYYAIDDIHALLWQGMPENSIEKPVDLHPAGYQMSMATAASNGVQVGEGVPNGTHVSHALLWRGTAKSVMDLHPRGYEYSSAFDTSHDTQVGMAIGKDKQMHAIVWQGDATHFTDLHASLNKLNNLTFKGVAIHPIRSFARSVDKNGNIVGEVICGIQVPIRYAVLWTKNGKNTQ